MCKGRVLVDDINELATHRYYLIGYLMLFMVYLIGGITMLESINPWSRKPSKRDYPLPDVFRFGTEDNSVVGDVLETGAIIGTGLVGAYKLFSGLTDFNEYMAYRNAHRR